MRAADPSLEFTVCGIWWDEAWHEEVLAKIGHAFENVSFHDYTRLIKEFEGEAGRAEFRRVAAEAPQAIFRQVQNVRSLVDAHAPAGKPIGISFDEWNVWYAWYRPVGVAEGVYTASMLHHFCRNSRDLGITFGAFFEPVNEGAIWVRPGSAGLTAMGQAFRALKAHQRNQLIRLSGEDPGGGVDAVASLNQVAGEILVTLINRNAAESHEVALSFANPGGAVRAEGTLLSAHDFLPESVFTETPLEVRAIDGASVSVTLPRHSIAVIRASLS